MDISSHSSSYIHLYLLDCSFAAFVVLLVMIQPAVCSLTLLIRKESLAQIKVQTLEVTDVILQMEINRIKYVSRFNFGLMGFPTIAHRRPTGLLLGLPISLICARIYARSAGTRRRRC